MLRKLGIGFIVLATMTPGLAAALGVGEYQLNSYLNQPLDMTVQLHDVKGLSADQVIVNLASQDQFDAAGVDRTFFLNDLKFDVQVNGDNGELHITSSKPVREPYLDFLVQFLWPTGRLMREYTVLLDPPSYDNATSTVAPASASQPAKPVAPATNPTPASAAPSKMAPPSAPGPSAQPASAARNQAQQPARGPAASGEEYRVKASDTMWRIASDHRPAQSVSVQQTMMAIQEMNPDAFINDNVNLVRRGAVLRLPSERQIRRISSRQALSQVASQNRKWRQMLEQKGLSAPSRAPVDASGRQQADKGSGSGSDEGRVKLVTPKSTQGVKDGDTTGTGGGNGSANTAALQNELAIRDENVDRLDRANKELRSRLDDLSGQVDDSQKLLKLRSEQIAALQDELRKLQKEKGVKIDPDLLKAPAQPTSQQATGDQAGSGQAGAGQTSAGQNGAESDAATGNAATQADTNAAGDNGAAAAGAAMTEKDTAGNAAKPQAKPAKPPAKPKPAKPAQQSNTGGIVDLIMRNLLYLGAALVVILLLIMLLVRRRGGDGGGGDAGDTDYDDGGDDDLEGAPLMSAAGEAHDLGEPPEEDLQDENMDPMERADVYVAYGQHPQAVDYLRNEINQAPSRGDLKIRLLELLKEMGEDKGFHQQSAMFAGTNPAVDAAIKRLGGDPAAGDDQEMSLDDLEMDLASDLSDSDAVDHEEPAGDRDDELDDFDFTLDDDEEEKAPASLKDEQPLGFNDLVINEPEPGRDADGTLDFSLDDEDEDTARGFNDEELSTLETADQDDGGDSRGDSEFTELDLDDLDLDLDLDDDGDQAAGAAASTTPEHDELSLEDPSGLDIDAPGTLETTGDAGERPGHAGERLSLDDDQPLDVDDLDLSLDDLDFDDQDRTAESHPETPAGTSTPEAIADGNNDGEKDDGALDLSDLDLSFEDESGSDELTLDEAEDTQPDPEPESPAPAAVPEADVGGAQESDDMLGDDDDFDFLGETDENATKLDLARAYIDMGDAEGARDILNEVLSEGSDDQQTEAKDLLARVG